MAANGPLEASVKVKSWILFLKEEKNGQLTVGQTEQAKLNGKIDNTRSTDVCVAVDAGTAYHSLSNARKLITQIIAII